MYDNITQTAIAVENPSQSAGNSDQTTPTKDNKKGNYDRAKSNLSCAIFINFYFYVLSFSNWTTQTILTLSES